MLSLRLLLSMAVRAVSMLSLVRNKLILLPGSHAFASV